MKVQQLPNRAALNEYLKIGDIGCEVGVAKGEHAKSLLRSQPSRLHLIDIWDTTHPHASYGATASKVKKRFSNEIDNGQVIVHHGDAFNILPTFDDEYFDWMYVDAWHEYEDVNRQIDLCLPKLKAGGILAGHDYEVVPATHGAGVIRAVMEAVQSGKIRLIAITNEKSADWISVKC